MAQDALLMLCNINIQNAGSGKQSITTYFTRKKPIYCSHDLSCRHWWKKSKWVHRMWGKETNQQLY